MPLDAVRTRRARQDQLEIWLYIAADNPVSADRVLDRFDEVVSMLTRHPEAGRTRAELAAGLRSFAAEKYTIFYRVTAAQIEVVRILSGVRDIGPDLFEDIDPGGEG